MVTKMAALGSVAAGPLAPAEIEAGTLSPELDGLPRSLPHAERVSAAVTAIRLRWAPIIISPEKVLDCSPEAIDGLPHII